MKVIDTEGVITYDTEAGSGLITFGKFTVAVPTTANKFSGSCILLGNNGAIYSNAGTSASPSFQDMNSISTGEIADGAVTLAKLASGVTPSHVVKYAGTITWSGSGASKAATVTGVAATDIVTATIKTAPTEAAYLVSVAPTTNTITVTLSAANTSNDAVIAYQVLRAAA